MADIRANELDGTAEPARSSARSRLSRRFWPVSAFTACSHRPSCSSAARSAFASHSVPAPHPLAHVLRRAGVMVAIGLAAGLAGALGLTRVLATLLFEVSPLDPLVLASRCYPSYSWLPRSGPPSPSVRHPEPPPPGHGHVTRLDPADSRRAARSTACQAPLSNQGAGLLASPRIRRSARVRVRLLRESPRRTPVIVE